MRRLLFWFLVAAFLWALSTQSEELTSLIETLLEGHWDWVLGAALLQVFYFYVFTAAFQSAFDAVEIKTKISNLLPVTLGSLFVNAVAPAGGAAGVALYVDDVSRRGNSGARATAAVVLQLIADFSALTLILIVSMIYLFVWETLSLQVVIGSAILTLITAGLCGVLGLGLWRPGYLKRIFAWIEMVVNRFMGYINREEYLPLGWAEKSSSEFIGASLAMTQHPKRAIRTALVMLVAHLLAIASMRMLFVAFDEAISLGPLVAGYAIGILTWIISPAPQGTGVIEGVTSAAFVTLGVPWNVAVTVTLAFRGIAFWLPVVLGFFLLRRVKTFDVGEAEFIWADGIRLIALMIGAAGVLNILPVLAPDMITNLLPALQFSPLTVGAGQPVTALAFGFVLVMLGVGVWRRKRIPWIVALAVLGATTAYHAITGTGYVITLLSCVLFAWLLLLGTHFTVRSDEETTYRGLSVMVGVLAFDLVLAVVGLYGLTRFYYQVPFNLRVSVRQAVVMATQFHDPGLLPLKGVGEYFAYLVSGIGGIAVSYAALAIVSPVRKRGFAAPEEREQARGIVEAHGRSSMAFLTLFDDKHYFFSPGGSLIAYTLQGRTALTLGDPIGPKRDATQAIANFRAMCQRNDWRPAFCLTMPDYLEHYEQEGFRTMCMGQEAIVDLNTFSLKGRSAKSYRKRYNRMIDQGYQVVIHEPPITDDLLEKLRVVSDEWLTMTLGTEKRFFLGRFDEEYLRSGPIAVVYTPDGSISAFSNIVSEFQLNEITIDLMRRRKDAISGTMDFLFVALFLWGQERGYDTFNLGLCALSGACAQSGGSILRQSIEFIYKYGNWFYHFKGLRDFKDKFRPYWTPQFLNFHGYSNLPAVWMAMVQANSGEGDLPWKFFRPKPENYPGGEEDEMEAEA
ncbi:MAG: flippase-like domain-containing protein [Chloroflexota bacterium]